LRILISMEQQKWYWPALGAVPGALRRKYPTACIDLVASARQAELFAALPDVRQVAQTPPEDDYDIEISLGDTIAEHYKNEMLGDEAARARARALHYSRREAGLGERA